MSSSTTLSRFLFALVLVVVAIFLASDADLTLLFLPEQPKDAFDGQVVWITGASSGIGASLVQDLVSQGAQVVISARRKNKLEEIVRNCEKIGKHAPYSLPLDVLDFGSHEAAYDQIMKMFGKIDVLVLNAGRSQRNIAVNASLATSRDILELNFFSVIAMAKTVLPHMIERNSGHIVVMSSLSGRIGTPIASSYSASKFALHGFFDALRAEVSSYNISVSLLCPGPVESEIAEKAFRDPSLPKQEEGKKMATSRCTYLIAKAMYYRFGEVWISENPFLLMTYIQTYVPWFARQLMSRLVGPSRVKALKEGSNIYDVKTNFGLK